MIDLRKKNKQEDALIRLVRSNCPKWIYTKRKSNFIREKIRLKCEKHFVFQNTLLGETQFFTFISLTTDLEFAYITASSPRVCLPLSFSQALDFKTKVKRNLLCSLAILEQQGHFALSRKVACENLITKGWKTVQKMEAAYNLVVEAIDLTLRGIKPFQHMQSLEYISNCALVTLILKGFQKIGFNHPRTRYYNQRLCYIFGFQIAEKFNWTTFPLRVWVSNMHITFQLLFSLNKQAVTFTDFRRDVIERINAFLQDGSVKYTSEGFLALEIAVSCYNCSQEKIVDLPGDIANKAIYAYAHYAPGVELLIQDQKLSVDEVYGLLKVYWRRNPPSQFKWKQ